MEEIPIVIQNLRRRFRSIIHAFCEAPILSVFLIALAIIPALLVHPLLALPAALLFFFVLYFFRDPYRITPENNNYLYSSADGKVVRIGEVESGFFPGKKVQRVLVFMSPLNVHRNRAPILARVRELQYIKGQFLPAFRENMELVNERASVVFEHTSGKKTDVVVVTQIAGILARRIVCRAILEKEYRQGEEFGLIRFGSANEILFGCDWQILVKEGDRVQAGLTVIARRKT